MATNKDILLIQRLLTEGTEQLSGEWWVNEEGNPTFADGDVGDYNHAMIAFEAALGISLDDAPEMIPMEPLSDEALEYLANEDINEDALEYLKDGSDPRDYVLKYMGWVRVKDNEFQCYKLTDDVMYRIGEFLHEMLDDDSGDIIIEDLSENKLWSIPARVAMVSGAKAQSVKHYARSRFREEDVLRLAALISEDLVPRVLMALTEDDTNGDVQKEYEQRFDLKTLPDDLEDPSEINQGLLFDKPGFSMRVRREIPEDGEPEYTLTCKFYKKSDEAEVEITEEMFDKLWPETIPEKRMSKTRYRYNEWVVDDIREPEEKIVAEIETTEEDEDIEIPDHFEVV